MTRNGALAAHPWIVVEVRIEGQPVDVRRCRSIDEAASVVDRWISNPDSTFVVRADSMSPAAAR